MWFGIRLLRLLGSLAPDARNPVHYDLRLVALLPALLVDPRVGLEVAVDVDLTAFHQILRGVDGVLAPADDLMPFGLLVLAPALRRGDGELRQVFLVGRDPVLGIPTEVSDQQNLVE
jgi:hypothetical protein